MPTIMRPIIAPAELAMFRPCHRQTQTLSDAVKVPCIFAQYVMLINLKADLDTICQRNNSQEAGKAAK